MSLPEWVRAKCRAAMRKPSKSMAERQSNVNEEALKHGYIYDSDIKDFVYVGEGDEPKHDPATN